MTSEGNIKQLIQVLVTDYAWLDLKVERDILNNSGVELLEATTGDEQELLELVAPVDGILTCWKAITASTISQAQNCKCIGRYGIGLDNIDVEEATKEGILVTNVPSFCIEEVSDHAMALMLSCARKITTYSHAIKQGTYDLSLGIPITRLRGKTMGILGWGKIGRSLGKRARVFGLRIIACDPQIDPEQMAQEGAELVSFEDLLKQSDFISIHTPLTPDTQHLFGWEAFQHMKRTAFIINTSRGDIVDTVALQKALDGKLIAGAALDVLPQEPPALDSPLLKHERTIITPHAAFYSEESLMELRVTAATQMANALTGKKPENIVNLPVLEQPNLRVLL